MFNIGPGELMAILAVALIILGPTRLPQAVRTVGRVVGELRRISSGFQDELRNAFEDSDVVDQLEKGPRATPVVDTTGTLLEQEARKAAGEAEVGKGDVPETPVVDTTGTLPGEEPAADEPGGDDIGHDVDDETETDSGGVDTAALGVSGTVPTEPAAGTEDRSEGVVDGLDDDPPETDQRAAS